MKKILYTIAIALSFTGCSLHEELKSSVEIENFYNNAIQCQTGINSCYNNLRSMLNGHSVWMMCDCQTDCMYLNASTVYVATLNISPTRPTIAATIWQHSYAAIMRANSMLAAVEKCRAKGGCTDAEALSMTGELIVIRSFLYYLLTSTFGDVPYYTDVVTESNRAQIASLPRMSADETRSKCVADLLHYIMPESEGGLAALPFKRTYDAPVNNRMGAAIGLMVGAKMCLWNKDWQTAIKFLSVLEGIYGKYDGNPEAFGMDYPMTDIPFCNKYTKESIFEISNVFEEYGLQSSGYIAVVATPAKGQGSGIDEEDVEYEISDIYAGMAVPELGEQARISTSCRPTTYYYETVLPYDSPDIRGGEYSAGSDIPRGGSGNLAWRWTGWDRDDMVRRPEDRKVRWFNTGSATTAGALNAVQRPWLGNKFWCPNMYYTQDSNNPKFFRYADAVLMMGEAYLNLGQYDKAAAYLNVTRVRAGLEKLSLAAVGGDPEALMEEFRLERARELFGEFQRKFDLVRWGIWYERTLQYNDGMYLADFIQPYHRFMPIPAEQVTYSGGALDNNEYLE